MANRRPFYRHGFTIVELLVAVVVIAVLASITVVAYNNVQQRAYSAKVISAVDTYVKALKYIIYRMDVSQVTVLPGVLA